MLGFVQAVPTAALLSVVGYIGHLVNYLGSGGLDRLPPGIAGQEQVMVRKEPCVSRQSLSHQPRVSFRQPLAGGSPGEVADIFPQERFPGAASPVSSSGAFLGPNRLQKLDEEQAELFQSVAPSVCVIFTEFPNMANLKMPDENHRQGVGSGIVWDKKGHIVTNFHVINNAEKATVALIGPGGLQKQYAAKMTGVDPDTDIAVLKIDADEDDLWTIPVGDSTKTRVGQMSFAVGNVYGQERTLTAGVISGNNRVIKAPSGRQILGVLQTDAVIGPGNSGGPLLDSQGRIIGISTASVSAGGPFTSARVAFAVPMSLAAPAIQQLIDTGRIERAVLGVKYLGAPTAAQSEKGGLPYVSEGVVVGGVFPGSSAEAAGLLVSRAPATPEGRAALGDVIVAIDDHKIRNPQDMRSTMSRYKPGETVDVTILRGQELEKMVLKVKLGSSFEATQFSKLQDERSADSAAKTSPASLPSRA